MTTFLAAKTDHDELLHHLLMDKLWKMGIIVGVVIIALIVMAIVARKVGRR
ncbi:hypothetical protein IPZ61_28550 [Streptomyces sioyaensis]|uniref:hypothetical protein n=1 Tax=Streptomyces sioyaensis TaxID=67364 RepID=UPI001F25E700|nr:hypothetical protein [Streptomyces sioyaensis]MCF3177254.1 hypothetical protein [Streptomyces sioyaensis]